MTLPRRLVHNEYDLQDLPDQKGRPLDEVRASRDDIARRIDSLLADETLK
jgi:hypothetical protein